MTESGREKDIRIFNENVVIYSFNIAALSVDNFYGSATIDETTKSLSFRHIIDAKRFLAGRMLAKKVLSKYAGITPADVIIRTDENKKPFAVNDIDNSSILNFNISHSGNIVMVAFSCYDVGIDVEEVKTADIESLFEAVLSTNELLILKNATDKFTVFYELWTRKEAMLKAIGIGLIDNLSRIDISNGVDDGFMKNYKDAVFELHTFKPADKYVASICCKKGLSLQSVIITDVNF